MKSLLRPGPARALAVAALVCVALAAPGDAHAGLPSPGNSTIPSRIFLVGYTPAGADSASGHFEIVIRDFAGNPVGFVTVILQFVDDHDYRVASDQMDPRLHVLCPSRTFYTLADANGVAHFTILGGGRFPLPPPGPADRVSVSIDGVPFATMRCISYDMNGSDGISLADLSLWRWDFFGGLNPARADFDDDGVVGVLDLSWWAASYFSGRSVFSPSLYCP